MPFLAAAAAVASIVGTGVAVYGQQQAAKAAEATGRYNAELARNQAAQETSVAAENARRKARDNARYIGAQRAALAKAGLSMEGTPLAVLGETASALERDIMDLGFDAANKSRSLLAGANLSIWKGNQEASAMRIDGASTALRGFATTASGFTKATGTQAPAASTSGSYLG
jgi:hypothetical protein